MLVRLGCALRIRQGSPTVHQELASSTHQPLVRLPRRPRTTILAPIAFLLAIATPVRADELPPAPPTDAAPGSDTKADAKKDENKADAKDDKSQEDTTVTVRGRAPVPSRGASDFNLRVGELARVPRQNAADLLKLAPGILLTNKGGDGHAEQVFLRGFDAREGQDIEFTEIGRASCREREH